MPPNPGWPVAGDSRVCSTPAVMLPRVADAMQGAWCLTRTALFGVVVLTSLVSGYGVLTVMLVYLY